jgi:hypothetical protein
MQKIAILGVLVAAGAILVLALPHHEAAAADDLAISSTITYDIQNTDVPVRVTWDVNITDNDPATQPDGSGTLTYYDTVNLPVVRGAANVVASDEVGRSLSWKVTDVGKGVAESLAVNFADPLFYGDS